MPLILSVLAQTALCGLVLAGSLFITVVPEAEGALAAFQRFISLLTALGLAVSVLLIVMYRKNRERALFRSRVVTATSLTVFVLSGAFFVFGVLI